MKCVENNGNEASERMHGIGWDDAKRQGSVVEEGGLNIANDTVP